MSDKIEIGTRVRISHKPGRDREYGGTASTARRANDGREGKVIGRSDAHGLCAYTYAAGGERDKLANAILDELGAAGVELRATQLNHAKFTVLANTTMPAVLVEYLFHNCKTDVALLKDSAFRDKLARATAKGICNYLGIAWDEDKPADTAHIYRVQAGAFSDRANAEAYKQKMVAAGFPGAFIVTV